MIKLIAFDWNGTLIADTKLALAGDNHALKAFGYKPVGFKKFQACFDIPIVNYWRALGLDETKFLENFEKINKIFHEHYENHVHTARTKAGTRQALKQLSQNNIDAIIFSNHTIEDIIKQLKRFKIESYFKTVLGRPTGDRSHMHTRGKAQKLNDYVRKNKLRPSEVVSVGDTIEEIEIGKEHGFYTVGITGGYNSTARLTKAKPNFIIRNMEQLIPIIKKLNKK